MTRLLASALLFLTSVAVTQADSKINVSQNQQFLDWLVEQKIPNIYQPDLVAAKVPKEIADKAIQQLIAHHKNIQNIRLKASAEVSKTKNSKAYQESSKEINKHIAEMRTRLHKTLGDAHYLAFCKIETANRLSYLTAELDRNTRDTKQAGLSDSERAKILKLITKHLTQNGVLIKDHTAAYPDMVSEAKQTLTEHELTFFVQRFGKKNSRPVFIYRPLTLAPGQISSMPF